MSQDLVSESDRFEEYEARFDPALKAELRSVRLRANHRPKVTDQEVLAQIAEAGALEGGLNITYKPSRYESGWLTDSLRGFFEQDYITDVLSMVKGGKEATVYCCRAHPSVGVELLAAKVYRPRRFRNLRNDKMYREGREVLGADGRAVKPTDTRVMRALGKKTAFGVQVAHTSWLMHEFNTLQRLHHAGVSVPKPYSAGDNALLMSYVGDADGVAPTLSETALTPEQARACWAQLIGDLEAMTARGIVHGDLSAYNLMYWQERLIIIDWPQVTTPYGNRQARRIFDRDVERVCQYFAGCGVACDPVGLAEELWQRYLGAVTAERAAQDEIDAALADLQAEGLGG